MGFRIKLEDEEEVTSLLSRVTTSIRDCFPKPFCGYLIFLFTFDDDLLLKQFQKNLLRYDALTGPTVAFVIFAEKFTMKVKYVSSRDQRQSPKSIQFDLQELANRRMSVSQLVKDGKVGWTAKGDELTAISYATNHVARELKILSLLPCLVVFDALPKENDFKTFALNGSTLEYLAIALRNSLDRLHSLPNYSRYKSGIEQVSKLEAAISGLELLSGDHFFLRFQQMLKADLTTRISSIKKPLDCVLSEPAFHLSYWQRARILEEVMLRFGPQLRVLAKLYATLANLAAFEQLPWPLSTGQAEALQRLYTKFIRTSKDAITIEKVAADREAIHNRALTECGTIARALHEFVLARCVDEMSDHLPYVKEPAIQNQANLKERCRMLQELSQQTAAETQSLGVSFSDIFSEALGKGKRAALITSSGRSLHEFLRPWLRPQTLLFLAKHLEQSRS